MFADEFLPVYDVSGEVAAVVAAEPQVVWEALLGERPGEELALGLAGKFWRPAIECTHVPAE